MTQQTREIELLGQLVGEWIEGVVLKKSKDKLLSSYGTMATKKCQLN
jgi:hypothetical protein